MRSLWVATAILVAAAGAAAHAAPPGPAKGKSAITLTLGSLGCSTALGGDSFDVLAWSWGASNSGDPFGGGGGAGKANVQDLSLTKAFDGCSPALFGGVVTGKSFPTAILTASNKDGTTTTVTMTDVRVSSWSVGGTVAGDAAGENVTLSFAKVCLADGSSGAKFCFDIKTNTKF